MVSYRKNDASTKLVCTLCSGTNGVRFHRESRFKVFRLKCSGCVRAAEDLKASCLEAPRREYRKSYRLRHPDSVKRSQRAWRQVNGHKVVGYTLKRQMAMQSGDLTSEEWQDRLNEFLNSCAYCGSAGEMEIEHMVPLSRNGKHTRSNVVPACGDCNRKKGSKTLMEFARELGHY